MALNGNSPFTTRISRRGVLRTLSASALMPWIPRIGQAQTIPIKRMALLFQPNGVIMDNNNWRPAGGTLAGAPLGTLSRSLAAFAPLKSKISVITGLNQPAGVLGDPHLTGMGGLWTGSRMTPATELSKTAPTNNALANGQSIDWAVAKFLKAGTKFEMLKFHMAGTSSNGLGPGWLSNSYSAAGQQVFGESNPFKLFDKLFEGFTGLNQAEIQQLRAENKSVLDRVSADFQRVAQQLGTTDKAKLDLHLTHIRSIETRLSNNTELATTCDSSEFETQAMGFDADSLNALTNDLYPQMVRLHSDLAVLAFRCDLSRVINLQWGASVAGQTFNWFDYQPPQNTRGFRGHHEHSHDWNLNTISSNYLRDIDRWYAQQVYYFISELNAMEEGNGTMLDNSVVVFGNEIARGNHTHIDYPFLVAGGAAGALKMGRNYDLRSSGGLTHNRLLVSMARAMGMNINTFGTADPSSGGLSALEA